MRKSNFKTLFSAISLVFALFVASAGYVQGQGLATNADPALYGSIKANFVGSSEAEAILDSHVQALHAFIQGLVPGSPAYQTTYRASVYYRSILQAVQDGKSVSESVIIGTGMFATPYFTGASYSEKLNLRTESINLLKSNSPVQNSTF